MNIRSIIEKAASLKLTVVLLSAGMFLTLAGTLAQVNNGIWTVVAQYFRSPVVWVELHLFPPEKIALPPAAPPPPAPRRTPQPVPSRRSR